MASIEHSEYVLVYLTKEVADLFNVIISCPLLVQNRKIPSQLSECYGPNVIITLRPIDLYLYLKTFLHAIYQQIVATRVSARNKQDNMVTIPLIFW